MTDGGLAAHCAAAESLGSLPGGFRTGRQEIPGKASRRRGERQTNHVFPVKIGQNEFHTPRMGVLVGRFFAKLAISIGNGFQGRNPAWQRSIYSERSNMSLLAVLYQLVPEAPILVAANREEKYDRVCPTPSIQPGKPRVLASIDPQSAGTCLGVNQAGMFCGLTSRRKIQEPANPKSRRVLCREMLKCGSAREAVDLAMEELHSNSYAGGNFVVADGESGWVVHAGSDVNVVQLQEGLSIVGHMDVNDGLDDRAAMARRLLTLQMLDSPVKFLAVASKVFARQPISAGRPSMVVRQADFGTVSSTLISLGKKPRDAIYQYANGAPDQVKYEDYSPLLRDILSRGLRESRTRANA